LGRNSLKVISLLIILLGRASLSSEEFSTVCNTCAFHQIGDALKAAPSGSTVLIKAGVYKEALVITKPVKLQAEDGVILDGGGKEQPITIFKSDGVTIRGFTIQNSGISYTREIAGIRVVESKDCHLIGNKIIKANYGIYLEKSDGCEIRENTLKSVAKDEASSGNGIHVWTGKNHHISKNTIQGHRDGIYLEFAENNLITDNFSSGNLRYGLHFMFSHNSTYRRNYFQRNGSGVAVMYSKHIIMNGNHFVRNTGPANYGLLLKEITDSDVSRNQFLDNTSAIFMEGTNRVHFEANQFSSNGWALRIMSDCEDDDFVHNNFVSNTFDAITNSDRSLNNFHENYWSQYDGYDLNRDGIGDKPYYPSSLSSIILERVDSSYILLNSFFLHLMDQVERALPELIPEKLKDEKPLMKPYEVAARD
jgi:nitrous oxidase accessory protein